MTLNIGLSETKTYQVKAQDTACAMGSGALEVLATPALIAQMEQVAWTSVQPYLEDGQGTVGTEISVSHLAPTPVGMTVRCISRLCAVNGRELILEIEAYDEMSLIARAIHKRFIIQNDRFMDKALRRKTMPQQD